MCVFRQIYGHSASAHWALLDSAAALVVVADVAAAVGYRPPALPSAQTIDRRGFVPALAEVTRFAGAFY